MIKKTLKLMSMLLLTIFSFYYTNKSIELIRDQDPIMKEIKNTQEKYIVEAVDAIIEDNTIIPGKVGKEIDYEKSYNKMKQYGSYNEVLTSLKEVKPTISVENNYDKFIISGNPENKSAALVFKIEKNSPKDIITILNNKNVPATFFIDSRYLEDNYQEISTITNFELELLNNDSTYDELYFTNSKEYLESLTNKNLKYCYSEVENNDIIKLCKKLNMHTILPSVIIKDDYFQSVKDNLKNGQIFSFGITEELEKNLPIIIDYVHSRGYQLKSIETLLSEIG